MPLSLQLKRLQEADYNTYKGKIGEITYDKDTGDTGSLVVHDGQTEGGNHLINEKVNTDIFLSHNNGVYEIVDRHGRTLLDDKGRYPKVLSVSRDSNNNFSSNQVLEKSLPPTPQGQDQYVIVLGKDEVGDGYGGVYVADQADTAPPLEKTYTKIPIQANSDNGHWKYIPTQAGADQVKSVAEIRDMDISLQGSERIFFLPTQKEWFIPTQIDVLVKDDADGQQPTDTVYEFGHYLNGQFIADQKFKLRQSNYIGGIAFSHYFRQRKAYKTNTSSLYLRVSSSSTGGKSVTGDVALLGYFIDASQVNTSSNRDESVRELRFSPESVEDQVFEVLEAGNNISITYDDTGDTITLDFVNTLTTDDFPEGSSNLYYSDQRVDDRIAAVTTDKLSEGSSNLYYTGERVRDDVASLLQEGANINLTYNDSGDTLTIAVEGMSDVGKTGDFNDLNNKPPIAIETQNNGQNVLFESSTLNFTGDVSVTNSSGDISEVSITVPVDDVAGKTGSVSLEAYDLTYKAEFQAFDEAFSSDFGSDAEPVNLRNELDRRGRTPHMFGAVGDGTTDDSNAFQELINSIPDGETARFIVPIGDYKLDSPLDPSNRNLAWELQGDVNLSGFNPNLPGHIIEPEPKAKNITYTGDFSNAISVPLRDELDRRAVTPEMFGAVGDGQTDDSSALADADASGGKAIVLTGNYLITSDIVLDTHLVFRNGFLSPDTGVTVTINGSFNYVSEQIFSGQGSILFGNLNEADIRWWGASVESDIYSACQSAVESLESIYSGDSIPSVNKFAGKVVKIPGGDYTLSDVVRIKQGGIEVKGDGVNATSIKSTSTNGCFRFESINSDSGQNINNCGISNVRLIGTATTNSTTDTACQFVIVKHGYCRNVKIENFNHSLDLVAVEEPFYVNDCTFWQNSADLTTATSLRVLALSVTTGGQVTDPDDGTEYRYCSMVFVQGNEFRSIAGAQSHHIKITGVDGLYVDSCHLLNGENQADFDPVSAAVPLANVSFSNTFFDGTANDSKRNIIFRNKTFTSELVAYDTNFQGCKFNGVSIESLLLNHEDLKRLTLINCLFDKSDGSYLINAKAGKEFLLIDECQFILTKDNSPSVSSIHLDLRQSDFFRFTRIKQSTFLNESGATLMPRWVLLDGDGSNNPTIFAHENDYATSTDLTDGFFDKNDTGTATVNTRNNNSFG